MNALSLSNDEPKLRLCCIRKTANFAGYGFDLRNLKHRRGHFIGNIDVGSPAEAAGLRQNDRIIEVNGINVANENHYQVVERIKAVPTETRLLVVDQATDDYYKDKVVLNGEMPNIVYLENKPENDSPDNNSTGEMNYSKANGEMSFGLIYYTKLIMSIILYKSYCNCCTLYMNRYSITVQSTSSSLVLFGKVATR